MSDERTWFEKLGHFLSREPHSQSQLIEMLRHAQQDQLIDRDALQMIEGVIAVSDKKVRDIMIPRTQMVAIDADLDRFDNPEQMATYPKEIISKQTTEDDLLEE